MRQKKVFIQTIEGAGSEENAECKKKGFYGFVRIDNINNNIVGSGVGVVMTNLEKS